MAPVLRATALVLAVLLVPSSGREASALRNQQRLQAEKVSEKMMSKTAAASKSTSTVKLASATKAKTTKAEKKVAKVAARAKSTLKITSKAEVSSILQVKTGAKLTGTVRNPELMGGVNVMRAEMCAHQEHGVSSEHDECVQFMTEACNPGPDMLMNGTPGEISSGHGYCTSFFADYQAFKNGGEVGTGLNGGGVETGSASGVGVDTGSASGAPVLPDSTNESVSYPEAGDRTVAGAEEMEGIMAEVGELMEARSSNTDEMKENLAALNWYEDELQSKIDALDEDEYCRQIEKESVLVGQETSAPEMASMLSDMRCEMHRYSLPFYTKLLERKLTEVRAEQKELVLKIEEHKHKDQAKVVKGSEPQVDPKSAADPKPAATPNKSDGGSGEKEGFGIFMIIFVLGAFVGACFFFGKGRGEAP